MMLDMRTTLDLDEDVLRAARVLADQERVSLGKAVSMLVRRALVPEGAPLIDRTSGFPVMRLGPSDHVITDELVARYRDDD